MIIDQSEVFPDNKLKHNRHINLPDGWYDVKSFGRNCFDLMYVKDKSLMEYKYRNVNNEPYKAFYFNYENETIDIELLRTKAHERSVPRRLFWSPKTGVIYEKNAKENYNNFVAGLLNTSMQLEGNVKDVTNCIKCGQMIVNCIDGRKVRFCRCFSSDRDRVYNRDLVKIGISMIKEAYN